MSAKSKESNKADAVVDEVPLQATEDVLVENTEISKSSKKDNNKTDDKGKAKKSTEEMMKGVPKGEIHWRTIDPIIKVSFIVFILACAVVIGNTIVDKTIADHSTGPVVYTDTVYVNYVGSFYTFYDQDGAVIFDTNIESVGTDSKYVKSPEFSKTSYSKYEVDIANGDSLKLFRDALIGHNVGDTVKVMIPAADGYGELSDADKGKSVKTGATLNTSYKMTSAEFESFFGKSAPTTGEIIMKSPYGWDARVTADSDGVTVQYMPVVGGDDYKINDKCSLKVTSVTAETITFDYVFDFNDQMIKTIVNNTSVYIIGVENNEFTYKTTDETVGEDLYFTITILEKK